MKTTQQILGEYNFEVDVHSFLAFYFETSTQQQKERGMIKYVINEMIKEGGRNMENYRKIANEVKIEISSVTKISHTLNCINNEIL